MRRRRRVVGAALAAAFAFVLASCGVGAAPASEAPPAPGPSTTVTPAIGATEALVRNALGAAGFQLSVPQVPFRPAESPTLAAAPRGVFQVKLPEDQEHGFLVIYELPTPAAATAAAQEQVAYVESGPGRVQFAADARFVLRQVGSTVIFYSWSPGSVTDPAAPGVADAIATVGMGYPIQG
jgi:hypothetical protein